MGPAAARPATCFRPRTPPGTCELAGFGPPCLRRGSFSGEKSGARGGRRKRGMRSGRDGGRGGMGEAGMGEELW